MTDKLKEGVAENLKSVAKQPLLSLLLIIFLVQSYIMVVKLDTINETLVAIHKDNVRMQEYVTSEKQDTEKFIMSLDTLTRRVDLIYEHVK